ncbi:MAG: hypothetical protein EAX96_17860 [Candidatus Lokiarchaeota archaeon]|nr:hypothetical protein [Candidatus Lokiarchaeota archaeon]
MNKKIYMALGIAFLVITIVMMIITLITWSFDVNTAIFWAVATAFSFIGTFASLFWASYHHFFLRD